MLQCLSMIVLLSVAPIWTGAMAQSQTENPVNIAVGKPGSESFVFGTELWALSQIALKPNHGIGLETVETAEESERLTLLRNTQVEVALVRGQVPTSDADNMRTVMTLWPEGKPDKKATPAQLVAREDVADDVIYRLTKAIYENMNFFRNARATLGIAPMNQAMAGAELLVHPGAYRYYDEEGFGDEAMMISLAGSEDEIAGKPANPASTFDNFDDVALGRDERSQVAAACRQALELGSLSAVLGDLSSRGCEVYQAYLIGQENGQRRDVAVKRHLFAVPPGGQGGPAITIALDGDGVHPTPIVSSDNRGIKQNPRQPTM